MNLNSVNDLFIFNFPTDFVSASIEEKYKVILENYGKPYPDVLSYINSTIKDVNFPGMNFPKVAQKKYYGKERNFRGATSPYDLYTKDINITFKSVDFNIIYFIIQDCLLNLYMRKEAFLDNVVITTLDKNRRELFKLYFSEMIPASLSDMRMGYQLKDGEMKEFTVTMTYNFLDIEFVPHFESDGGASGDLIDDYSNQIDKNKI